MITSGTTGIHKFLLNEHKLLQCFQYVCKNGIIVAGTFVYVLFDDGSFFLYSVNLNLFIVKKQILHKDYFFKNKEENKNQEVRIGLTCI